MIYQPKQAASNHDEKRDLSSEKKDLSNEKRDLLSSSFLSFYADMIARGIDVVGIQLFLPKENLTKRFRRLWETPLEPQDFSTGILMYLLIQSLWGH